MSEYDAVVVGAGPNGFAAAITLAGAGLRVLLREAASEVGGGLRSAELTLPGYIHDVCATVHPLGVSSPLLRHLPLAEHGVEWVHAPAALAHPLDDGTVALLRRSVEETAATLGEDGQAWRRMLEPLAARWLTLAADVLAPLRVPRHPLMMAHFALRALRSAAGLARGAFRGERARALLVGNAAHSMVPLHQSPTAAFGLTLVAAGHAAGWPIVRGGSRRLAAALAEHFRSLGGEIVTGAPLERIDELDGVPTVLLDLTPRQILRVAGHRLPAKYRDALERFRYGAGVFKVEWALSEPIPWRSPECAQALTVHLGGTTAEIVEAEDAPLAGRIPEQPFVLLGQPTLFDPSRAPAGGHIAWAYCHVPFGSPEDMTARIEAQVERFAPGFRDCIVARCALAPADLERHDANLVGGDISAGVMDLRQIFFRPVRRLVPYETPVRGLYLCSASTPPGGAVHGMCGFYAAAAALGHSVLLPVRNVHHDR
ncbi:MAG TPA: NAD(P)/FAD-dependent oxidoreductase, partial [Gemmatimonadaceae bacterium]|nr:NAD(P)/FAD-dependent oxidoreductase [Gemmatimonadaceae bacterium]